MPADDSPPGDKVVGIAALNVAASCGLLVLLRRPERFAAPRDERAQR